MRSYCIRSELGVYVATAITLGTQPSELLII